MSSLRADLPTRQRVIYSKNPLVEVICAVQFPAVLALSQDVPSDFQKRIANDYPLVEVAERVQFTLQVGRGERAFPNDSVRDRTFKFKSEDSKWVVSLEPALLGLTCSMYTRWEEMLPRFLALVGHVFEQYQVPFITRIGLRYKSILTQEILGLKNRPWNQLLRPEVVSSFEYFTGPLVQLPGVDLGLLVDIPPGKLRVKLATVAKNDQTGFLIDADCFADSGKFRSTDECRERLIALHEYSGKIFQACITDDVHNQLDPQPP